MRFQDGLYFAPGVRFIDLDLDSADLSRTWARRIDGFYLQPARAVVDTGHAFAAGVLAVSAIDAIARTIIGGGVGKRVRAFARDYLPSFRTADAASALYSEFRNGLIHEGRIKKGAEFSLDAVATIERVESVWRINPELLVSEIAGALGRIEADLTRNQEATSRLASLIRSDFATELLARPV